MSEADCRLRIRKNTFSSSTGINALSVNQWLDVPNVGHGKSGNVGSPDGSVQAVNVQGLRQLIDRCDDNGRAHIIIPNAVP